MALSRSHNVNGLARFHLAAQADNFRPALVFRATAGKHRRFPDCFWKNRANSHEQHPAIPLLYVGNCHLVLFLRLP